MRPLVRNAVLLVVATLCVGCTFVTVTKVKPETDTPSTPGQRFSLPRPYIQVTPQSDGSIVADVVYLPDPDRTYVIASSSYLASDTLEVTTDGGVIKTINWTGDSSAVVAQAVTSAGNVGSTILQNEQKQKADQQSKEDAATKAVDDAMLAVSQAQSDLAILIANNATPDAILKQRVALNDAVLKLQASQATLDRLRRGAGSKTGASADKPDTKGTFGPILFAVRDELQTADEKTTPFLSLVAVQQKFPKGEGKDSTQPTYDVKRADPLKQAEVRIFPQGLTTVRPDKDGNRRLTLQVSTPLYNLIPKENSLFSKSDKKPAASQPSIALDSPTLIDVDLGNIEPGLYELHLFWQVKKHPADNDADGNAVVDIRIVK